MKGAGTATIRDTGWLTGLLAVGVLAHLAACAGDPAMMQVGRTLTEGEPRPNVVVVMVDDLDVDTMNQLLSLDLVPNIEQYLVNGGLVFNNSFVSTPLCCPSRATFLTGQYSHNTGVISNGGSNALEAFDESETLGVWLQQAGYRTAFVGKYFNDYGFEDPERVPPGWSEWTALVGQTTQSYFDYDLNEDGVITHYGKRPEDYKTRVIGHL